MTACAPVHCATPRGILTKRGHANGSHRSAAAGKNVSLCRPAAGGLRPAAIRGPGDLQETAKRSPFTLRTPACEDGGQPRESPRRRHRVEWARLLARASQMDVMTCDACGGQGERFGVPRPTHFTRASATSNSARRHRSRSWPRPPVRRADTAVFASADQPARTRHSPSLGRPEAAATGGKRQETPGSMQEGSIPA